MRVTEVIIDSLEDALFAQHLLNHLHRRHLAANQLDLVVTANDLPRAILTVEDAIILLGLLIAI